MNKHSNLTKSSPNLFTMKLHEKKHNEAIGHSEAIVPQKAS